MKYFLTYEPGGLIHATGGTTTEEQAQGQAIEGLSVIVSDTQFPGDIGGDTHYVSTETGTPEVLERPKAGGISDGAAPFTLDMAHLPEGTTITVTNNAGSSVSTSDPNDPITLSVAGTYPVKIEPPFPYLATEQEVSVA